MAKHRVEIDQYILKSTDFAKPILTHFRNLVHEICPDVEEKLKWGMPHFDYNNAPLCHMASFKQHCAIGFWKAALMADADQLMAKAKSEEAMGHLGKLSSLKDLPSNTQIKKWLKNAMALNEANIKLPSRKKAEAIALPTLHPEFERRLQTSKSAKKHFEAFSPSHKREYINWINEAKTDPTRTKRIETAIEWISKGKGRNWKYEKK